MRIVDPHTANALLHRKPEQIPPIMPMTTSPIQMQANVRKYKNLQIKLCILRLELNVKDIFNCPNVYSIKIDL
jgi:hypothetical protein